MIGQRLTNIPQLTPMAFVNTALGIAKMLWDAPSAARLIPDIGLRVGEFMLIIVILLIFLIIAALAIFTLASIFLIIGPGSILASFMPCRFTSVLSEGYFTWIVRTGILLLMFYVVLGAAERFALQWDTGIANACGATLTTLPAPMLGGPPIIVSATTCTNPLPVASLLTLFADVVILAFIAVGVPFTAAAIVSHGVNMAIEHLASARYLAGSVARPMVRAMSGMGHQFHRMARSNNQSRLEQRLAAGAVAAAANRPSQAATTRLPRPPAVNAFGVQSTTGLSGSASRQTSKI
jgi:hypothetical protein